MAELSTPKYDEDVLNQLMQFGYQWEEIIQASSKVVDYTDINAVQQVLDSTANANADSKIKSDAYSASHQQTNDPVDDKDDAPPPLHKRQSTLQKRMLNKIASLKSLKSLKNIESLRNLENVFSIPALEPLEQSESQQNDKINFVPSQLETLKEFESPKSVQSKPEVKEPELKEPEFKEVTDEDIKQELVDQCIAKVIKKYPITISQIIKDAAEKDYATEDFWNDIYEADGDYESSNIVQSVLEAGFDDDQCESLYKFMLNILGGDFEGDANGNLPEDLIWSHVTDKKAVEDAGLFLEAQCPDAGFSESGNENLLRAYAVSEKNEVPAMTLFMEMFELSKISHMIKAPNDTTFNDKNTDNWVIWMKQCQWPACFGNAGSGTGYETLRLAIGDFKKRLAGNTFGTPFSKPIEDDISIYINYILRVNVIVADIMRRNKNVYPLQIDVVIIGKKHSSSNPNGDEKEQAESGKPLPKGGMKKLLAVKGIEVSSRKISLTDKNVSAKIQNAILDKIGNRSHQRIIVVIDKNENENQTMLYLYQLPKFDIINKDYDGSEEHMSFMTKRYLFPGWEGDQENSKEIMKYVGGGEDFGGNAFVFSFHVHNEMKVKCEAFIKAQRLPFLPHHMIDVWPTYFKSKTINDKYTKKYIYEKWKVPTQDPLLMKWIQNLDSIYYDLLKKEHLAYEQTE